MRTDGQALLVGLGNDAEMMREIKIDRAARVFRKLLQESARPAGSGEAFACNRLIDAIDAFTARGQS